MQKAVRGAKPRRNVQSGSDRGVWQMALKALPIKYYSRHFCGQHVDKLIAVHDSQQLATHTLTCKVRKDLGTDLRRGWFLAGKLRWRTKVRHRLWAARDRTIGKKFRPDCYGFIPAAIPVCHLGRVQACCRAARCCARFWTRSSASAGLPRQSRVFAYAGGEPPAISDSIRSTISRSDSASCGTFTRSGSRGGVSKPLRARNAPRPVFACQVMPQGERSS